MAAGLSERARRFGRFKRRNKCNAQLVKFRPKIGHGRRQLVELGSQQRRESQLHGIGARGSDISRFDLR
ncbi:hypothetical protein [Burkholderia glumae]